MTSGRGYLENCTSLLQVREKTRQEIHSIAPDSSVGKSERSFRLTRFTTRGGVAARHSSSLPAMLSPYRVSVRRNVVSLDRKYHAKVSGRQFIPFSLFKDADP